MSHGTGEDPSNLQPRPALGELLRTCVHPSFLLLRVDHVVHVRSSDAEGQPESDKAQKSYTAKLFLSDGELLIQALIHRRLANTIDLQKIQVGDLLEIYQFEVKRAKRKDLTGLVVYLGIEGCRIISRPDRYEDITSAQNATTRRTINGGVSIIAQPPSSDTGAEPALPITSGVIAPVQTKRIRQNDHQTYSRAEENVVLEENQVATTPSRGSQRFRHHPVEIRAPDFADPQTLDGTFEPTTKRNIRKRKTIVSPNVSSDEDAFETASIDLKTVKKRRIALNDTHASSSRPTARAVTSDPFELISEPDDLDIAPPSAQGDKEIQTGPRRDQQVSSKTLQKPQSTYPKKSERGSLTVTPATLVPGQARTTSVDTMSQPSVDPPYHTLKSLLHPSPARGLPRKNYTLTAFGVITYVSPSLLSRASGPLPAKRHIKVEDPSLYAQPHALKRMDKFGGANKGITVAVYRDAPNFKPSVGTVAVLKGVVMQKLTNGDVMLNIYPKSAAKFGLGVTEDIARSQESKSQNNRPKHSASNATTDQIQHKGLTSAVPVINITQAHTDWFITSPEQIKDMGYDFDAMQKWWQDRQGRRAK